MSASFDMARPDWMKEYVRQQAPQGMFDQSRAVSTVSHGGTTLMAVKRSHNRSARPAISTASAA
jgi:hypothetical protein